MISKTATTNIQRGFTFVELLVVLTIIAVGVAGMVTLQRTFLQSSVRAAERNVAIEIAQARLEQLRFSAYDALVGGTESLTRNLKQYDVTWSIAPQYFNSVWLTTGDTGLPDPLPEQPDAKAATIQVQWQERNGGQQTLTMEGWLGRIRMRDGGLVTTTPPPRNEPQVTYTPGAAPEVIAVRLTDDDNALTYQVKETTRPTPQVDRTGELLSVRFDTVTYDELTQTQRSEDFVTVTCSCRMGGIGTGYTPNRLILNDGQLNLDPNGNQLVEKIYGIATDTEQSPLCAQCCRDHHDNQDMVAAGTVYVQDDNRTARGNHRHYGEALEGLLTAEVSAVGSAYFESCRMRRVDGYYQMYPDWQLKALTVTSADYLIAEAGAAAYTDYVRDVVRALVTGGAMPTPLSGRDKTVVPGAYQMIGRAVYLDDMSTEHLAEVNRAINNNEADWINKVPFYEVNVTLLGNWEASNTSVAGITNEPIETIVDPANSYFGTYSRGRVDAKSDGQSVMQLTTIGGNSSVLGGFRKHPNEALETQTDALTITVETQPEGGTTLYSVTGELNCLLLQNGSYRACTARYYNSVSISSSDLNVTCSYSKQGNADTGSYSCPGIPAGSNVIISFSSDAGGVFQPSSVTVSNIQANEVHNVLMTVD